MGEGNKIFIADKNLYTYHTCVFIIVSFCLFLLSSAAVHQLNSVIVVCNGFGMVSVSL